MYFNDFSKMVLRKNMIFDALYRPNMVLQGNHFLKYLKILKNMTLCTGPSQGLKPVDLGDLGSRYRLSFSESFLVRKQGRKIDRHPIGRTGI